MADMNERRKEFMRSKHTSMDKKLGIDGTMDKLKQLENQWQETSKPILISRSTVGGIFKIKAGESLRSPMINASRLGMTSADKRPSGRLPEKRKIAEPQENELLGNDDDISTSTPVKNLYSPSNKDRSPISEMSASPRQTKQSFPKDQPSESINRTNQDINEKLDALSKDWHVIKYVCAD